MPAYWRLVEHDSSHEHTSFSVFRCTNCRRWCTLGFLTENGSRCGPCVCTRKINER